MFTGCLKETSIGKSLEIPVIGDKIAHPLIKL
jgi:hypothetical protein